MDIQYFDSIGFLSIDPWYSQFLVVFCCILRLKHFPSLHLSINVPGESTAPAATMGRLRPGAGERGNYGTAWLHFRGDTGLIRIPEKDKLTIVILILPVWMDTTNDTTCSFQFFQLFIAISVWCFGTWITFWCSPDLCLASLACRLAAQTQISAQLGGKEW